MKAPLLSIVVSATLRYFDKLDALDYRTTAGGSLSS
jgi:hypothetical protein